MRPVRRLETRLNTKPEKEAMFKYSDTSEESIKKSTSRARMKVRRLILGNLFNHPEQLPKFVTLTFDRAKHPLCHDIQYTNYEFKKFRQRLQHFTGGLSAHKHIDYIATPEKHLDGLHWHYHLVFMNMPFIHFQKFEKDIWGNGWTNMKALKRDASVANYITKYFTKSYADPTLRYHKRYFQALTHQPITITNSHTVSQLLPLFTVDTRINSSQEVLISHDGNPLNVITKTDYLLPGV